eukprot:TRINITY_DN30535_c0_g1_i1.p1 TRINITY_DN30535_c0_g1~~TRINITY_DN30535_c0_g1_i1.p1  ORF type:complete len:368 (+),score=59.74 TRINITY_DN30535_c0_g1_i1:50-1153(+)
MEVFPEISDAVARAQKSSKGKLRVSGPALEKRFAGSKSGIWINKDTLDKQVLEKKAMLKAQKEVDDHFARQAILNDKHAVYLESERLKQAKEAQLNIARFHATQQKKENSREWDMNDPNRLKNDVPPIFKPDCTVSSIQKFEGEDLDNGERRKAQAAQISTWMAQDIANKKLKRTHEKEFDALAAERSAQVSHRAFEIEQAVAFKRAERNRCVAEFNKKLSEQKKHDALVMKRYEDSCNAQEIQNMLDSDLLSDAPTVSDSKRNFRRLPEGTLQDIQLTQAQQRLEKEQRKKSERAAQLAADRREDQERRIAIALERNWARERKQERLRLGEDRKLQVEAARMRKAELAKLESEPLNTTSNSILFGR